MGLVGNYSRFVKGFTRLARPFTTLKKKEAPFIWTNEYEKSFQELKQRLTFGLVLALPEDRVEFDVYDDASQIGIEVILM